MQDLSRNTYEEDFYKWALENEDDIEAFCRALYRLTKAYRRSFQEAIGLTDIEFAKKCLEAGGFAG